MNTLKYSKKHIFDYITGGGEDLIDCEKLEDNAKFMMDVIKFTKDKRLYNLCSDDVKKDFEFAKFLIQLFKDDADFVDEVASYYFENVEKNGVDDKIDAQCVEMHIIMGKTKSKNAAYHLTNARSFYEWVLVAISEALDSNDPDLGNGFGIIELEYGHSGVIMEYFANKMLEEILFADENYSFEEIVHLNFKKREELESVGWSNFLISQVRSIDRYLGEYLEVHPEILKEKNIKEATEFVEKNWQGYLNRIKREKLEMVYDRMFDFVDENIELTVDDGKMILNKIFASLGLTDCIQKLPLIDEDDCESYFDEEDENYTLSLDADTTEEIYYTKTSEEEKDYSDDFEAKKFEKEMKSYVMALFKHNILREIEPPEPSKVDSCEIIEYDFTSKKVLKRYSA